ncbi:raffinose/stachyose/melibiose transport system permease protein [Paenibacillus sp. V4I3]|uniref:carbohydrate ABC transporter permease n=1 Tax=unclassified Paenibacillus TaxID=185978 RepID=UPI002785A15D|nr:MULTISPECIES: sugar ABC transporter permease [unclassified Paenibacillus]MDQ0877914.1 raffinose/stachyose/melibiose transport system permease protein [Paenibacillus sp. V4I3]MDQ0886262.1 raffinose/stachyose/melibiose transport system permease protein [Paenibacillus sp. V4I9]
MKKIGRNPFAYALFTLPTLLLFVIFFLYPMIMSLRYGFTEWNGVSTARFNGLDNFVTAFQDKYFWMAVRNNLYFISFSVGLQIPFILGLALLVSKVRRWTSFYKTMIFLPTILSTAVVGVLWGFIYHPQAGLLNQALEAVGLMTWQHVWLAEEATAMVSVLVTNAWQWIGFYVVLVLSAIYAIPKNILEAAELDGATSLREAWSITLPLLRPVIMVMILLSITGAMKALDIVYVMTGGNPYGITEVMATYMYKKAYRIGEYGYANGIAVLILLLTGMLTSLFGWFTRKQEEVRY